MRIKTLSKLTEVSTRTVSSGLIPALLHSVGSSWDATSKCAGTTTIFTVLFLALSHHKGNAVRAHKRIVEQYYHSNNQLPFVYVADRFSPKIFSPGLSTCVRVIVIVSRYTTMTQIMLIMSER